MVLKEGNVQELEVEAMDVDDTNLDQLEEIIAKEVVSIIDKIT